MRNGPTHNDRAMTLSAPTLFQRGLVRRVWVRGCGSTRSPSTRVHGGASDVERDHAGLVAGAPRRPGLLAWTGDRERHLLGLVQVSVLCAKRSLAKITRSIRSSAHGVEEDVGHSCITRSRNSIRAKITSMRTHHDEARAKGLGDITCGKTLNPQAAGLVPPA